MTKKTLQILTTLLLAPLPTLVAGTKSKETKTVIEKPKAPFITGDLGVAVVSEYVSRGVVNENQGAIVQPYLDLYFNMYEGSGFLNKIQLNLGLWSSIHSNRTGATATTTLGSWYEFDWMPGISFTFAKDFTFTFTYLDFDFVSGGGRAGNLNFSLGYDDSKLLGAWAVHPHVTVLKSVIGNPVGVPGANQGWYYEVGIAPSHTFGPVTLTVPLTVGLGDNKFYGGKTFGYFSAGATAAIPLSFIPETYGKWTLTSGATYYNQSSTAAAASAPGLTGPGHTRWVFSGQIGTTF